MKIFAEFRDDRDRLITLIMFIASIFFIFVPSLIVIFIPKNYISESTYQISKAMFNFELLLTLISLFFIVPIIGWLLAVFLAPILMIVNVVVIIMNIIALAGNKEIKIPVPFNFI